MSAMFQCTSCRHHMQTASESEEACLACFNQDNWEPPKSTVQWMANENEQLREENERLREAYGGVET